MCSLCRLPVAKNHNLGKFGHFGGSCIDPLLPAKAKFGELEQIQSLHLQAKFHLYVFIVSAYGGQEPQFGQIWTFWGLLYRPPFTGEGQIWWARADPESTLTGQISSECVYCVGFRWPKTTFFGKFWHFWAPVPTPFTDEGQIWCDIADRRCTFTCEISSRSVYSVVLWRRKTPIFAVFGIRNLVMSPTGINLTKLSTGAQLQTFPYPAASKTFLCSNAFMAKSGAQSLTFKSVTDRQTDKILNVFGYPGGGWNLSPTKLGMVIEDVEHVLAPIKIWISQNPQIKTPITP